MIIETIQTVEALKSTQVIFPKWMDESVGGMKDSDKVNVVRQDTPFGSYVVDIRPIEKVK